VVVFQPHRYTRTQALFDEFTRAFYQSDLLLVLPIYPAGEVEIPGVSHEDLCDGVRAHGHKTVVCIQRMEDAGKHLEALVAEGDVVITLGAGDVWKVGEALLTQLKDRQ
jgi:UDP-N-acetylmuramate--alanine ligase